ncbi:MAG: hypothetical protein GF355_16915 [Candidatus Eisenbacteria bacterium]|nr:hypothetical protein [Candidatus Eisenbacteria bacterium]
MAQKDRRATQKHSVSTASQWTAGAGALRLLLAVVVAVLAGYQIRHLILLPPEALAVRGVFPDDSYFYSVLAENFNRFGILTLDGEMPTNGVHPLWMFVQIVLVKLFPGVHEVSLLAYSSYILYVLFCFLAIYAVIREPRLRAFCASILLAGALLLNVHFQAFVVQGMETPLCLTMVVLTLLVLSLARERVSIPRTVLLAFLSAGCFFARTDLFWVSLVIGIGLYQARQFDIRRLGIYVTVVGLLVAPYLLNNVINHGGLMPISGRVKLYYLESFFQTGTAYLQSDDWRGMIHAFTDPFPVFAPGRTPPVVFTALIFFGALAVSWLPRFRHPLTRPLRLFGLAFLGHVGYMHLFYRELQPFTAYYFAPELIWSVIVLGLALPEPRISRVRVGKKKKPRMKRASLLTLVTPLAAVGGLVVLLLTWGGRELSPERYWQQRVNLAQDIDRLLPADARVAAFWPGLFAQFSQRLVTPLDGVIGSNAFFEEYVRSGREIDYILERNRPYLAVFLPTPPQHFFAQPQVQIPYWTRIGLRHLWESRTKTAIRTVAARPVSRHGSGWYLLEIRPREQ